MKKNVSLIFLLLSAVLFSFLYIYTETTFINTNGYFNYQIEQFVSHLLLWSAALFVVSIFAIFLDKKKYKIWFIITIFYAFIAVVIAWATGNGTGQIMSWNGEQVTWFYIILYYVISVIYLLIQYSKSRKQPSLPQ